MSAPPERRTPAGYRTKAGAGISVAAEIQSFNYNETENSASVKAKVKADDIRTFLPGISDTEYDIRAKIRAMRNCATSMLKGTDSETARNQSVLCLDWATSYIYAGVDVDTLSEVARICNRFMVLAMHAEAIEDRIR